MAASAKAHAHRRPRRRSWFTFLLGLLAMVHGFPSAAWGQELIPNSPWRVHDEKRPQPPIVRSSGAISNPPPADADVLFDGKSTDKWTTDGKPCTWPVRNGSLIASPGTLTSKGEYGAAQFHIEWRIPSTRVVNGQSGGNSGVFLMGLYEIQILQSYNNPTNADGTAGALYGQTPPLVNTSVSQGQWQSYDIVFQPPKHEAGKVSGPAVATVIHNGVVVHHARAFIGPTRHKAVAFYPPNHPVVGPVQLQFHGDPVEFRNIWVRPLGNYDLNR